MQTIYGYYIAGLLSLQAALSGVLGILLTCIAPHPFFVGMRRHRNALSTVILALGYIGDVVMTGLTHIILLIYAHDLHEIGKMATATHSAKWIRNVAEGSYYACFAVYGAAGLVLVACIAYLFRDRRDEGKESFDEQDPEALPDYILNS
eukprot:Blabericola_migrator_1__9853@NODE_5423_length_772_cov_4_400000_g3496_i0_p1_GENE_NODE_5423_length_772_cov_4_400000_g3496_i0NODE_5423_length_772_cov_4_400000_g3496_i0_p1_ORF_typecomplete_len149_score17_25ATG22/PF11700_8/0_013Ifi616/PF06140_13/0_1DUF2232/PF09991_9/0_07_NODE_5423_length_772_cov_4_400000_g3496_i019465